MNAEVQLKSTSLYDIDFQCWLDQTVQQLRAQDFNKLDLENLIEELESLGKSDKRAILSYLMRLCEHFLNLQYWESERERCCRGWRLEIVNFRIQIQAILKDSPSLKKHLQENFLLAYKNGRKLFLNASDWDAHLIPLEPDFTLEQVLDEDWFPWQPR